jgi:hypothetical protein
VSLLETALWTTGEDEVSRDVVRVKRSAHTAYDAQLQGRLVSTLCCALLFANPLKIIVDERLGALGYRLSERVHRRRHGTATATATAAAGFSGREMEVRYRSLCGCGSIGQAKILGTVGERR